VIPFTLASSLEPHSHDSRQAASIVSRAGGFSLRESVTPVPIAGVFKFGLSAERAAGEGVGGRPGWSIDLAFCVLRSRV